jgi:small subunit ribosomal protein S8
MLTRIRNAQLRGKSTVRTPGSKLRAWVLDVLKDEGYIRGYERIANNHQGEIEISLKYYEGACDPRDQAREQAGPPHLYGGH